MRVTMTALLRSLHCPSRIGALGRAALVVLATGCAVGPKFVKPTPVAPDTWTSWRSTDSTLYETVTAQPLRVDWWRAFHDPVLDSLIQRAFTASPDLRTAALHFAQARVQRGIVAAQRGPQAGLGAGVTGQRQSEYGAGTRMIDAIGGNRSKLVELLSEPFTLYQAGFDASWELDLWGRTRRSIEAGDADVDQQKALLEMAWLSLVSDVGRNYVDLRVTQRQIQLVREEAAVLEEHLEITEAQVQSGVRDQLALEQQQIDRTLWAQLSLLLSQEGAISNQIAALLGERPGALRDLLAARDVDIQMPLPDLAFGLPSEVALRRPDIRAAEARLRRATAGIGIARAALYPSIRLGARFGYESYLRGEFADWGSHTWSVGPSLDLPLFDRGRRRAVVQLRELEQQEAAVQYQQTVLRAWRDIDDAVNAYTAERQRAEGLWGSVRNASDAHDLMQARYTAGIVDYTAVLESRRLFLRTRRYAMAAEGRLHTSYIAINKALGNVPMGPDVMMK